MSVACYLSLLLLVYPVTRPQVLTTGCIDESGKSVPCMDNDSWPNIGKSFHGYDLVMGDPSTATDRGYKGLIFDEAHERSGPVRFENTNARPNEACDSDFSSTTFKSGQDYLESIFNSQGTGIGIKVGSDVDVGTNVGGSIGAQTSDKITLPDFGLPVDGLPLPTLNSNLNGGVTANTRIPPLLQASSSNSKTMGNIIVSLETNLFSITKSTAKCDLYTVLIQTIHHPTFKKQFIRSVKYLNKCWRRHRNTPQVEECAKTFIDNYGTHYISMANFGSKATFTKIFDSNASKHVSKKDKEKCSVKNMKASLFGAVGGNADKNQCEGGNIAKETLSSFNIDNERIYSVGSRPKNSLSEWADQIERPEIIKKEITPLSNLFTDWFMDIDELRDIDYDGIRPWLDTQIKSYCYIFQKEGRCHHVTRRPVCTPASCSGSKLCGYWTGPVDLDFLPDGQGTFSPADKKSANTGVERVMKFKHGCVRQEVGSWSDWGEWGSCSVSCGSGTRQRSRYCRGDYCNQEDKDEKKQSQTGSCFPGNCPVDNVPDNVEDSNSCDKLTVLGGCNNCRICRPCCLCKCAGACRYLPSCWGK